MADITEKQLKTLKKLIESAETNLAGAKELLTSLVGSEETVTQAEAKTAASGPGTGKVIRVPSTAST